MEISHRRTEVSSVRAEDLHERVEKFPLPPGGFVSVSKKNWRQA
jgi:hypothetical protein